MTTPALPARQRILNVARELFYREGIRAIGIDTIVGQSGVAKMTLYRHFPSKDDLVVAFLEDCNRAFWEWFEQVISQHPNSAKEQLNDLFEALVIQVKTPVCLGCPFLNTATEFPEPEHPGHRVALAHKQALLERFTNLAQKAEARDPNQLANQLLLLMDGAYVSTRLFGPSGPANSVKAAAITLIDAQLA